MSLHVVSYQQCTIQIRAPLMEISTQREMKLILCPGELLQDGKTRPASPATVRANLAVNLHDPPTQLDGPVRCVFRNKGRIIWPPAPTYYGQVIQSGHRYCMNCLIVTSKPATFTVNRHGGTHSEIPVSSTASHVYLQAFPVISPRHSRLGLYQHFPSAWPSNAKERSKNARSY